MKNILVDTGYFIALYNQNDSYHSRAIQLSKTITVPLVTTWPVVTETHYLLQAKLGGKVSVFYHFLEGPFLSIFSLTPTHLPRIRQLSEQYANLPADLADISLIILAETQEHGQILTTDRRDFETYRFKNTHPFENLLDALSA